MQNFPHAMNRRTFIVACGQLAALLATFKLNPPLRAAATQASTPPRSYGTGIYGQAAYIGTANQIYLPLVSNKGE